MKILIYITMSGLIYTTYEAKCIHNEEVLLCDTVKNNTFSTSYYDYHNNICDSLIFHNLLPELPVCDSLLSYNFGNDINFTCNYLDSFQDISFNHNQLINNSKNDEISGNSIVDFLDTMDTVYIPEELNNSELQVLDLKEVDDFFENEQPSTIINSLENYVDKTVRNNIFDINITETNENFDYTSKMNFLDNYDIKSKKYVLNLKKAIIMFINQRISNYYRDFYIKRLLKIEIAFNEFKNLKRNPSRFCDDDELLETLNRLYSYFRHLKNFNSETWTMFSINFDLEFFKKKNSKLYENMLELSLKHGIFNFYFEMIKLHKYIKEIPEFLTLCKLFIDKSYCDGPFVLHLINLFIDNIGNPKDNRGFILCMIYKAFLMSYRRYSDLFVPQEYSLICNEEHFNNIYFFLWEIQCSKRSDMLKRMEEKRILEFSNVEVAHFKTILLVYLYQHMEFFIFYNFNDEVIEKFIKFFTKVLESNDCFVCLFDEFLNIVKNNVK